MRAILQCLLVLVIAAALASWAVWLVRDDLVAAGLLPEPAPDRVEFPPQALPPIEPKESVSDFPDAHATGTAPVDQAVVQVATQAATQATTQEGGETDQPTGLPSVEVAQDASTQTLDCVVAGPFNQRDDAAVARDRVRDAGADAHIEEQTVDAEPYYLVYVEPAVSRDEARRTLLALQAQGIDDVAVIQAGERANGVSVGRFTSREFATARSERIAALGYEINLLAIDRDQAVYRVRVRDVAEEALADLAYVACDEDP